MATSDSSKITIANEIATRHIVKTSSVKGRFGGYHNVAVLEVLADVTDVKMISTRARGVVRIVRGWYRVHGRGGPNTEFARALREARTLRDSLNEAR
jgi:hypothetical protein